ncbi:30S ribosomal protein S17e, partial [Candidatus Bathyarchaeota archaeon]|nr:30S ribosomal protein S17e [Candidatus Bathyarchaeota archaeon]
HLGKVRSYLIKKTAEEFMRLHQSEVTTDFELNKQLVKKYLDTRTKKMRNRVAGYLTSLKRVEEHRKQHMMAPASVAPPEEENKSTSKAFKYR